MDSYGKGPRSRGIRKGLKKRAVHRKSGRDRDKKNSTGEGNREEFLNDDAIGKKKKPGAPR